MEHPHPEIERGERYEQTDIEALFDTGFGYRVSGINVRNDDEGDRYVLLFAREGGPYDDDVSARTFTYVGEGLPDKGDQSPETLGNAALIEAESDPVPIYFFYKSGDGPGWEYQGQVAVEGHETVYDESGEREVLEFEMRHLDGRTSEVVENDEAVDTPPAPFDPVDTAGRTVTQTRAGVRVSESFKQSVYDRFDGRCAVTGIDHPSLLTVSHVLPRAERPDIAEDPRNALLLNWTHHFAFDAALWTFDEAGRLWVNPEYDPADRWMTESLRDRHGDRLDRLRDAGIADEYLADRNESLNWWPPS
ncbi:HNH endonuclease [Halolamina sp. C58]|uniref:HNH endonuclease n=1 Tax=Halolamina sp. C58 TaxID=3421640 RepID=UPI003EBBDF56